MPEYDDYIKFLENVGESSEKERDEKKDNVETDDSLKTIKVDGVEFKMVKVEGGTFMMGATSEQEGDASEDEKPAHSVTLSDYYIGKTVVTQALWKAVMGGNWSVPSNFQGYSMPIVRVSWYDVHTFIEKLNAKTRLHFRMPTEAEWEYAARGGSKSWGVKYTGGNDIGGVAWFILNSRFKIHPVGQYKRASELGLCDMCGNVWEWCSDWYGVYPDVSEPNPKGPDTGQNRVIRGGCWISFPSSCRVSNRNYLKPNRRDCRVGFRLILCPQRTTNPVVVQEGDDLVSAST